MDYLFFFLGIFLFVFVIFIRGVLQEQRRKNDFRKSLYDGIGSVPDRKYTTDNSRHIPGYYQRHQEEGQLDDITWNDLNLDDVFKRINYTHSATGEEYLYFLLRSTGQSKERLLHLEEVVQWMTEHVDEQVDLQICFKELGYTGKYSLYEYIENLDSLGKRSNAKHLVLDFLFIPILLIMPFRFTIGILALMALSVYQIISYFKDKAEIEPYIISFAYLMRLLTVGEKICRKDLPACQSEKKRIQECIAKLQGMKNGSFFVFTASNSRTSGNPLELILDYLRMVFHLDLIIFNKMLKHLRNHLGDIDTLITEMGWIEATISVSRLRASLNNLYCIPKFLEEAGECSDEKMQFALENGYHILLEHPVKNSIVTNRGVLLTGSNASGKSTFLKMVALNAVLAQTIHTCCADAYCTYHFQVYSSMALRDDLINGESYYIVEIKSLKRILDAVKRGQRVLCFVDEVLRGTNTVERIAASTQILKSLTGKSVICFAATHDIELTELLRNDFDNYHFEDEIKEGDFCFTYRLMEGKATTRNAIRLLELMGYAPEITEAAFLGAQKFMDSGVWQS